jgi:hypothetical protein
MIVLHNISIDIPLGVDLWINLEDGDYPFTAAYSENYFDFSGMSIVAVDSGRDYWRRCSNIVAANL